MSKLLARFGRDQLLRRSMFSRILEFITGKDDVERVAAREDLGQLDTYLKTRPLLIPKRPRRFLDAFSFTEEQLLDLIREESEELSKDQLDLWILEVDGQKRLPAFSSKKKMEAFSGRMSMQLNKVFSLGCIEVLLTDVTKQVNVDFIDLNPCSKKSWTIEVRKQPITP